MTGSDSVSATSDGTVDAALADLAEGEQRWAELTLAQRRELLDRTRQRTGEHAAAWVAAAVGIKSLVPDSPLVGEEWLSGPYALALALTTLAQSVAALEQGKSPLDGAEFGAAGGRTTVKVLPNSVFDALLLNGFRADVWLQPGVDEAEAVAAAGLAQRAPADTGGIGVVLGAGNITSIAPLDALYELYAHNRVVALKLNPLTDPMLPVLTEILEPFISLGALRILTGAADVGTYLVNHDLVSHVHMTGSAVTHDAIVWGVGAAAQERKAAGTPLLDKPMTSELGGVSPTIVLPGAWSKADIEFQATHVATQRLHNGGYNCVATQAVIISADWPQKQQFLDALRTAVDTAPARAPYYPGSDDRVQAAQVSYPDGQRLGDGGGRLLLTGLAASSEEALLQTEYFAPVLGVVEIPGTGVDYVDRAVTVANDQFVGTLGVNIVASPKTIEHLGAAFDSMIEGLRYGTVAVNAWTAVGYLTAAATWGAFPGHTLADVQSGIGVVHNALLIDRPERTVVRGPFRPSPRSLLHGEFSLTPKPPWFIDNKTAAVTGERLARFAADPGWSHLPSIFASALRG